MDVTRAILPHFHAKSGGGIINISSGAGLYSLPLTSIHAARKFALEGWTERISYELASHTIVVKSVIPHGGVTSTAFGSRASGNTTDLSAAPSYGPFLKKTMGLFGGMIAARSISSSDVAEVVYTAATDGKNRLRVRYFVGHDVRGFVKAKYESNNDEEYMNSMHTFFQYG